MIKNFKWLLLVSITFVACNSDEPDTSGIVEEVPATSGTADFSKYVALGNSLTAGFSDGALFATGQNNAYPKMLSEQFALAGGGEFKTPFMNDNFGGLLFGGMPIQPTRLLLAGFNADGTPNIITYPTLPSTEITTHLAGSFNNMGVPGAKSFHLLASNYGDPAGVPGLTANPYFVRFASNTTNSVLQDAMAQSPTFFSLWIGGNDVLGYALSGGDGSNPITDVPTFTTAYTTLVNTLTSNGAKGVIGNIPDVKSIPHFKVVPYNPLSPSNPSFGPQIPTLNALYAQLNAAFVYLGKPERSIQFSTTANSAVVVQDESIPNIQAQLAPVLQAGGLDPLTAGLLASQFGQCRQATAADLFVLPSSSIIGKLNTTRYTQLVGSGVPAATAGQLSVNGVTYPLQDKWVLLPSEQDEISIATTAFNQVIANAAADKGLAFVDAFTLMNKLAVSGVVFDNFHMTSDFIKGGVFGLDGIHITARGNAYIANQFIDAINKTYNATLPFKKAKDYPASYPASL